MKKLSIIFLITFIVFLGACNSDSDSSTTDIKKIYYSEQSSLVCPFPQSLPFEVSANGFNHPDEVKKAKESGIFIGFAAKDIYDSSLENKQVLTGQIGYGSGISIDYPIGDEWISIWFYNGKGWVELGRTKTDESGKYLIELNESNKFDYGTYTLYVVLEGDKSCTEQMISLHPEKSQFVVTDIDGTLTIDDNQIIKQMENPSYVPVSWPGAVTLMTEYYQKGYYIIYLTARPDGFRAITREWLISQGYPVGVLMTAPGFVHGDSAAEYKKDFIKSIVDLGWEIIAAHGNAESDIIAYQNAGIPNDKIFIIGENAGLDGSTAVDNYPDFITSYVNSLPNAVQPDR